MSLFGFGGGESTEKRSLSPAAEAAFAAGDDNFSNATPQTALQLTAVYSCMYVLSSSLAQLPLHIMRKSGDNVEKVTDHPAYWALCVEPNKWQTSYKWRETEEHRRLGWGNSYTRIIRKRGQVDKLESLPPWNTMLQWRMEGSEKRYYYVSYDDTKQIVIDLDDMIHVKDFSYNEKIGTSRISTHAVALGWGLSMQDYGKSFFGSNGRPTGVISPKGDLNDDSWTRFKSVFSKSMTAMKGSENKTMLLPAEVSYQAFTIPPEDMQFLESRGFSWNEICSLFNVPPHMTQNLDKATFNNTAELGLNYVKFTMMPNVRNWEEELNRKLFTRAERMSGYYVKFDLAGLLRGTPKDRAEFYKTMIDMGVYSRNEVRLLEDRNKIDGLDDMVISQNMKSVADMEAETQVKLKQVNGVGNDE